MNHGRSLLAKDGPGAWTVVEGSYGGDGDSGLPKGKAPLFWTMVLVDLENDGKLELGFDA